MRGKVIRRDGELSVPIPADVAEREGLKEGMVVEVMPAGDHPTLEELLEGITEENRHDYVDWGPPVGNEEW